MKSVLHSFAYCLEFLREQMADVPKADMVASTALIKASVTPTEILKLVSFSLLSLADMKSSISGDLP